MPTHESKASTRDDADAKADDKYQGGGERDCDSKHADAKSGDDTNGLVKRVIEFFFDNDDFAHTFEKFAQDNCHAFDLHDDEMKLEYVGAFESSWRTKCSRSLIYVCVTGTRRFITASRRSLRKSSKVSRCVRAWTLLACTSADQVTRSWSTRVHCVPRCDGQAVLPARALGVRQRSRVK
jgi:hypothetical protein